MAGDADEGFLARWARRKRGGDAEGDAPALSPGSTRSPQLPPAQPQPVPRGQAVQPPPADAAPAAGPAASTPPAAAQPAPAARAPAPTLDDVAALDARASDFRRFVARDVDPAVKNAALKKLFTDPHFNTMDGLDVYIDDYGKPSPLPPSVLRKMAQTEFLGWFAAEDDAEKPAAAPGIEATQNAAAAAVPAPDTAAASAPPTEPTSTDEDAAVRLQPDDAARPGGDPGRAREDAGREP